MTEPTPNPKYIYKILPSSAPPSSPLPEALPLSALDEGDGFLHMSTSHQILGTLSNFFSNETHVWILRIPYERVSKYVKWEDETGQQSEQKSWDVEGNRGYFPHIHGNGMKLGKEEVDNVGKWERGEQWTPETWPFDEDIPAR